jgi:hypothetical protein
MQVLLIVLALSGCLVTGLAQGLVGTLKLHFERKPDAAPPSFRRLLALSNLAFVALLLLAGALLDWLGPQPVLIGGSLLLAGSLFALGVTQMDGSSRSLSLVAAFGAAGVFLATIQLMPRGLLGEREVAASLLFGFVFIALAALVLPPLVDVLRAALGFRGALTVLAVLAMVPAGLAAFASGDAFPPYARDADHVGLLATPKLWFAGLVFFFYAPLEAFISIWTTTYLSRQTDPNKAARWLAYFWASLLGSRALFGLIQHVAELPDSTQPLFLVVPALLAAVVLGNMSGSTSADQALSGLVMLGLFLGPVLPMLLAILLGIKAVAASPGLAVALLYACGAVGSLVLSPLVASSAEAQSILAALRIPLFVALLLTAAALLFALTTVL